jgi:DNA-binding NtrC family response regulator
MRFGAFDYITKLFDLDEMLVWAGKSLDIYALAAQKHSSQKGDLFSLHRS